VARFLNSRTVEETLIQAMLDSPMFTARWRWNASISLAIRRASGGKRTPPNIQRMAAEDLIAVVFPDQIACAENLSGPREIPDHPLVKQTLDDCLHQAMDVDGLKRLLSRLENGEIKVVAKDLPTPSPLAAEILGARPYAFLDDAPLEERRTNAVAQRRWLDPQTAADMGRLDPAAIAAVRAEAWPEAANPDELHDALYSLGLVTEQEGATSGWAGHLAQLMDARRATKLLDAGAVFWVCAECLPMIQAAYPRARLEPEIAAPDEIRAARDWTREAAVTELIRGRLQGLGPVTARELVESLQVEASCVAVALAELESEGFVLRGRFSEEATSAESLAQGELTLEWCERRLLARIHRYTIKTLRAEIEPVSGADFMRFLLDWQGVTRTPKPEGVESLAAVIAQLEGYEIPAAAWEGDVLAARMHDYDPHWLDSLCLSGRASWARLQPSKSAGASPVRSTPIALVSRRNWGLWNSLATEPNELQLSHGARLLADYLREQGASFFDDMVSGTTLLRAQAETALGELVSAGLINADSFSGLRALLIPSDKKRQLATRRRRIALFGLEDAGRWSLIRKGRETNDAAALEQLAEILLRRYGVVFRRLLEREADWLPPWHALLRVFRRLEAQGKIRGGRFVAGMSGEQYALPDAVSAMRAIRRQEARGDLVSLSAADPLNLVGIITPGPRVPALTNNRVLYRDGVPVATHAGGESDFLVEMEPGKEWEARQALLRKTLVPGPARAV
jgi:ATP-dependent Lhr-like helicase